MQQDRTHTRDGPQQFAVLLSADGTVLGASDKAARALGLDPQGGTGNCAALMEAGAFAALRTALDRVAQDPTLQLPLQTVFHGPDGRSVPLAGTLGAFALAGVPGAALFQETDAATRDANARFTRLADTLPGAFFESHEGADGTETLTYSSGNLGEVLGLDDDPSKLGMTDLFRHVLPEDLEDLRNRRRDVRRRFSRVETTLRLQHPQTGPRWVTFACAPGIRADGSILWHGHFSDITEQMTAESRLSEAVRELYTAHERMNRLADNSPGALFEYREDPEGNQSYPYFSASFSSMMGVRPETVDANSKAVLKHIHREDMPRLVDEMARSRRNLALHATRFRLNHPEDGERWLRVTAMPFPEADGSVVWYSNLFDVTPDAEREEELRRAHLEAEEMRAENERQALHDGLTGLPNRRFYDKVLADRLAKARTGAPADCILIRLDLDHFKNVNDTLGHEAGDAVLIRVADVLRRTLAPDDFAARIGGDEFSLLLAPGRSRDDARVLVQDIQCDLAEPLLYDGRQCRFGASFGIACTGDLAETGEDIQLFADAALYRAKEAGRNRQELFTPELHRELLQDRRLAMEIHEALDRDQFVPFFQPQVAAETGALVGVEALLRWHHPTEGLLTPDAFMHVAEQMRVVPDIDRIMMEKSRDALARWRANGLILPKISFNVSSGRMQDPNVVAFARDMTGGDTRVTFELLESILVEEESDAFRSHLDSLREAGIEIEIDDFGSGHASIIGLMEIAPAALKIDKRIVLPVTEDARARKLVRAIVEIAETLEIATVAEGVETEEHATILTAIGCDVLQGYHFAHPLNEEGLLAHALGTSRNVA